MSCGAGNSALEELRDARISIAALAKRCELLENMLVMTHTTAFRNLAPIDGMGMIAKRLELTKERLKEIREEFGPKS